MNVSINASANFTDPDSGDTHTATWNWGDGNTSPGTVDQSADSVTGSHTYTSAGVYTLTLIVTDNDGASGQSVFSFIVIYNQDGGFVTGGGWIMSPVGAYVNNPSLTGKANFGFNSKYKKGANVPTGETEFNFKVASMNFHSSEYEWLVVAGANAKYKGSGTINNAGDYGFMLTATDGQINGGGGVDKFRIKIWNIATDAIVYDNKMGVADDSYDTQAIGGGSIVIHKGDAAAPASMPEESLLLTAYPIPANPEVWIPYKLSAECNVVIRIYDVMGRQVRMLNLGSQPAGYYVDKSKAAYWDGQNEAGEKVSSGIYFYNIQAGKYSATRKMLMLK